MVGKVVECLENVRGYLKMCLNGKRVRKVVECLENVRGCLKMFLNGRKGRLVSRECERISEDVPGW